jgi:hypothetical protein
MEIEQWMIDLWTLYGISVAYGVLYGLVSMFGLGLVPARLSDTPNHVQWVSRIPSTLHALLAMYGGMQVLLEAEGQRAWAGEAEFMVWGATPLRSFWAMHTAGYITYALFLVVMHHKVLGDPMLLMHHVLVILTFVGSIFSGVGTFYVGVLLLNEASSPFLNINFFLAAMGYKGTLYVANGLVLFVSFFLLRIVLSIYWLLHVLFVCWPGAMRAYALPWESGGEVLLYSVCFVNTVLFFVFILLNVVWLKSLAMAVTRELSPNKQTSKEKKV